MKWNLSVLILWIFLNKEFLNFMLWGYIQNTCICYFRNLACIYMSPVYYMKYYIIFTIYVIIWKDNIYVLYIYVCEYLKKNCMKAFFVTNLTLFALLLFVNEKMRTKRNVYHKVKVDLVRDIYINMFLIWSLIEPV